MGETEKGKELWTGYHLTLTFTNRLMAGIPANPEIIRGWLETRGLLELQGEVEEQTKASSEMEEARLVFKSDGNGLYLDGYTLKSHIKDCANVIKDHLDIKALRSKVADRVYVVEQQLLLSRDGKPIMEAAGIWEHPVHVMTMQGPRSALKGNDYVEGGAQIFATLKVLQDRHINEGLLRAIFGYGSLHGFGAERGLGFGRYEYELARASAS